MSSPKPEQVDLYEPVIQFEEDMLADWFKIPENQIVELALPRVAFDELYVSIANLYDSLARVQRATIARFNGHEDIAKDETEKGAAISRTGFNHLRKYQMIIMALATGRAEVGDGPADVDEGDAGGAHE